MSQKSLKELRSQKGWSQSELAALSGLSVKTIQRIENGQGVPSLETAKSLGSIFDMAFSEFLPSTDTKALPLGGCRAPAVAGTASSQVSLDASANLLLHAQRYWRPAALSLFVIASVGLLAKLYLNIGTISADVSEIVAMRDTVSASDSAISGSFFAANLQRESGVFSDYYGSQAKYELQTYAGEAGPVRGVSLLELQMMRDIGRIVSAWGGTSGSNPDVRSPTILNNHLRCYSDSRESFDSANQIISKMHECIYTVLSDANWILNKEVDQALENLAQVMRATSPDYQAIRLVAPQVTQR